MEEIKVFVPGRLCLFGEHSDWASNYETVDKGYAIVCGLEQGVNIKSKKSNEIIVIHNGNIRKLENLDDIAKSDDFLAYIAGTIKYINDHIINEGIEIEILESTLPIKKGLSSSAAICVAVAKAYNELYNLNLDNKEIMEIAYQGERNTKSKCGRMDQICAYGKSLNLITFKDEKIDITPIKPKFNIYLVFTDLNKSKDTIKILKDLNDCFPNPKNEIEKNVHLGLGTLNENLIMEVIDVIENKNIYELGRLMTKAQNIFDNYVAKASSELEAPYLHELLNDDEVKKLSLGGKGVGSQGDGSIQFIVENEEKQDMLCSYLESKNLKPYKITVVGG